MKIKLRLMPVARRADLVIQELPDETLIYDMKSHKAHCLNQTAALVWKHCDGKLTVNEVARKVEGELGTTVSSEMVWLAVDQLEKLKLREGAHGSGRISRREAAKRIGISGPSCCPLSLPSLRLRLHRQHHAPMLKSLAAESIRHVARRFNAIILLAALALTCDRGLEND